MVFLFKLEFWDSESFDRTCREIWTWDCVLLKRMIRDPFARHVKPQCLVNNVLELESLMDVLLVSELAELAVLLLELYCWFPHCYHLWPLWGGARILMSAGRLQGISTKLVKVFAVKVISDFDRIFGIKVVDDIVPFQNFLYAKLK